MRARPCATVLSAVLLIPSAVAADDHRVHIVAADGGADFETISAAIEAAAPDDKILVRPGTYIENLHLDKPLTLSGDGAREEIVILHDESDRQIVDMDPDGPSVITIYVDDADVTIERISIMDEHDLYTSILLDGGTSTVRDVYANDFIGVRGDANVTVEDSYVERLGTWGPDNYTHATGNEIRDHFFASEGSRGRFEGNTVIDRPVVIESGAEFEIVDNTMTPLPNEPGVVVVDHASRATITGNEVEGGFAGVILEFAGESLVEGNTVHGAELGVLSVETPSTIAGNSITDAIEVGIVAAGNGMTISGNDIRGGRLGIHAHALEGGPPDIPQLETPPRLFQNNVQDVSHFGIVIEDSAASVEDNTICAGRDAFQFVGDADPDILTNEVCEASE